MKIKELSNLKESKYEPSGFYVIQINGEDRLSANDCGEPEDNYLHRDLGFVYGIVGLMKEAYEAGKNGEEFEVTQEKVEDY